ncbi:ABC transporter permease [Alicyclobacillus fastidiosus]|uniref:ABC transporter permease n=1 Tax=Alicyclobacillus fastidiosus TaxID=392011 RepID=A0ABY6ZFV5_9BACL|nr:ABC transporter permease [Alicyclobacillus fastidiosus]WAH41377.1 ABC transporter permease [Alicyclobacillus fastidiosus]
MSYVLKRIGTFIWMLWVATTLNFIIPRLMPGNPAEALYGKFQGQLSPAAMQAMEIQFGVNTGVPLWKQYLTYLWNMLHLNFGISYNFYPTKVSTIIGHSLPYTIGLVGISLIIAFAVGTVLGIYGAWKRNGALDSIQSPVLLFLQSVPAFWLGLMMLFYFGFIKGWFPDSHAYSDGATPSFTWGFIGDLLWHATLPGLALILTGLGGWMLGMRNMMVQTLGDDYITFAEAKGAPQRTLMLRYAARNAILPNFTGFGQALAAVVSGSVLVETIFSYPGIGYTLQQGILAEDYPLIQGIFLIIAVVTLFANMIVDILYVRLDPRAENGGDAA